MATDTEQDWKTLYPNMKDPRFAPKRNENEESEWQEEYNKSIEGKETASFTNPDDLARAFMALPRNGPVSFTVNIHPNIGGRMGANYEQTPLQFHNNPDFAPHLTEEYFKLERNLLKPPADATWKSSYITESGIQKKMPPHGPDFIITNWMIFNLAIPKEDEAFGVKYYEFRVMGAGTPSTHTPPGTDPCIRNRPCPFPKYAPGTTTSIGSQSLSHQ